MKYLIAVDERHIVRLLQVNLERIGHDVTIASSGSEAIALLALHTFDRVIVDYSMPSPNGYEVLEHIRTTPEISSLWVGLMIEVEEWDAIKQLPHQPDWISGKPFDPINLVE